jgi:hypothetical protein
MEFTIERGMRILPESSWRPVLQRSIDAFYEGQLAEGRDACLTLLAEPGLPEHIRDLTYRNQTFYAQSLDELVEGARWSTPESPGFEGSIVHGPGPVLAGDRLMVFLRAAGGGTAQAWTDALLTLDDDLRVVAMATVDDETGEAASFHAARLFFADGVLRAGVVLRGTHGDGLVRAGVVDLVGGAWRNLRTFGPRAGQFEAGWSPLAMESGVHVVSWWEPTEVFRLDPETSEFARVALRMAPHIAERFEGGSQGVSIPGGFLYLINERVSFDEGQPLSFSRFVRLNDGFQITAVSPQFFVSERGADAASGLTRQSGRLIAGFTSNAREALLTTMDLDAVLATLIPVAAPGPKPPKFENSPGNDQ